MRKLLLVLAAGVGLSATALATETVSDDVANIVGFGATAVSPVSTADAPPDPIGEGEPPGGYGGGGETGGGGQGGGGDKPEGDPPEGGGEGTGGGGEGGGTPPGSGGSDDTTVLTGVLTLNSGSESYDGGTLTSTTSDENVILAQSNACLTVSNYTLNKSGDTSSEDNSNFFALNAVVATKTAAKIYIDNSTLNSNAEGANCLFASGEGSTIYAYDCTLTSTKNSSRGLDATYEGTVIASKMSITTSGDHCASLATDRGNGYISVEDATLATAGQGSALIYSTGIIEANGVTGTATGAQIAGIEGLSTIRIKNSNLSGSAKKASEPEANGVIIYQSNSGDSTDGTATFEVSDSTLASAITDGAMFYITHSEAVITVQNTDLDFDATNACLIIAAGNDGSNGWGTAGSNGAEVVFTAIDQKLAGNISVDGISSLDLYLTNSTYTGTFVNDTTYTGNGDGIDLFISADSTWIVTASCTLKNLTAAPGAKIVDDCGKTVSIVNTSESELRYGTSDLKITVSTYSSDDFAVTNITDFAIDRSAFEAMYETEPVAAGVASEPYDDAVAATNAAAKINADKENGIAVPTCVEESSRAAYLDKLEATVTSDNRVVVNLTSAAAMAEQELVDAAVTNETAVASLASTNATATVTPTTPGLYYWVVGGTDVSAVTNAGAGVLSTNGGSVELTKPALDATKGRAFFRIAAGVVAPALSNAD